MKLGKTVYAVVNKNDECEHLAQLKHLAIRKQKFMAENFKHKHLRVVAVKIVRAEEEKQ